MSPINHYSLFEFHYISFSLEPYNGNMKTSSQLLKELIAKLGEKDFASGKRVLDRHKNRKGAVSRKLVHISSPFEQMGKRCYGKIALIKNKAPMTWAGKDLIEEIENPSNKEFVEITNFVINFNENSDPVIMVEFNNSGPRITDIEYYFRQFLKDLRIAKSIKYVLHLDVDYAQLDKDLKNVFELSVKVNAPSLPHSKGADWFTAFSNLKDGTGFSDARIQLFFDRRKDSNGKLIKNIRGLDFARNIIGWLKRDPQNIERVEDLKMSYMVDEDENNIIDLDFIKNKKTSIINIPFYNKTQFKASDFKYCVGQEFNYYLTTGKTNLETQGEIVGQGHA